MLIPHQASQFESVALLSINDSVIPKWVSESRGIEFLDRHHKSRFVVIRYLRVLIQIVGFAPDVIVSHLTKSGMIGGLLSRALRVKNIYFRHYQDENQRLESRLISLTDKSINHLATIIVTMSDETKN